MARKRTFNVRLEDDKNYELFFDNAALYDFEDLHGDTAMNVIGQGKMGFRAITNLVWAGLLHDKRLPITRVKDLIPTGVKKLEKVAEAVMAAVQDALEIEDESEEEPEKNEGADRQK